MEKQIVLVTEAASSGPVYAQWLRRFFADRIRLELFSVEANDYDSLPRNGDLYILCATSSDAFGHLTGLVPPEAKVVSLSVTFFKKEIQALLQLPKGTRAMLVNLSVQMAFESIAELNRLGVTQVEFIPVYPGSGYPLDVDLAITPGERRYVPPTVLQVLDLGPRVFTADTLVEIALALGFTWFPGSREFREYAGSLADSGQSLAALWNENLKSETYLDILMGALETGVLGMDTDNRVFALNSVAEGILGLRRAAAIGQPLALSCPELARLLSPEDQRSTRLIQLENTYISLSSVPVEQQGRRIGCFLLLQRFTEEEERQQKLRLQLYHRGYQSKYVFSDIIAQDETMLRTKQIAAKMAWTDSAILLTGESGTGKELFAHSIHHASLRRDMPFVAINCAALSDSLLESELFGYDEGAFTGARKGGKLGLFEYAHRGTLFLDEIEGMSQPLQIKLLRVLQEKELMRVGGSCMIPIDVRIIAASNENLLERVRQGSFRRDLYYRLNTLPLEIPPLRERGEDVLLIARHLMRRSGARYAFAPSAEEALLRCPWEGNVRELANLVEYLAMLEKPVIEAADLPLCLRPEPGSAAVPALTGPERFRQAAHGREEALSFLLSALEDGPAGRGFLCRRAEERGLPLTEQEVRDGLSLLHRLGLISVSRGRGGSRLTQAGRALLEELKQASPIS